PTDDGPGLEACTLVVMFTDDNGCTFDKSSTITLPSSAVSAGEPSFPMRRSADLTGSINITPSGGVGPYTFSWADGPTTEDRTGLAAGTYTVTLTDHNGCTFEKSATITQPASAVSASETHVNVLCFGARTGSIKITGSGGIGPYAYALGAGAFGASGTFGSLA